jgi:predicted RNase H-like HicB family nuclease
MIRYAVIIEKAADGAYSVYAPDLPGCVGMGATKDEALTNMAEAIQFHIEGLRLEGFPIPKPTVEAENLVFAEKP